MSLGSLVVIVVVVDQDVRAHVRLQPRRQGPISHAPRGSQLLRSPTQRLHFVRSCSPLSSLVSAAIIGAEEHLGR